MISRISSRLTGLQNCSLILQTEGQSLYLGDYTAAIDRPLLDERNIKTVLTVAAGLPVGYASTSGIHHKTYNALDVESFNLSRYFNDTYDQIEAGLQRGSVLVHCAAGVSRSATIVISYLMKKQNLTYAQAFSQVKRCRPIIFPNFGFVRQLKTFEKALKQPIGVENGQKKSTEGEEQQQLQIQVKKLSQPQTIIPTTSVGKQIFQMNQLKPFSKSLDKYAHSANKINSIQEKFHEPNIITYSSSNKLIQKKKPFGLPPLTGKK